MLMSAGSTCEEDHMPQLKCDEWPDDEELTTTEQEVPITENEMLAIAEFRAHTVPPGGAAHAGEPARAGTVLH
jgi:hypothetical protein